MSRANKTELLRREVGIANLKRKESQYTHKLRIESATLETINCEKNGWIFEHGGDVNKMYMKYESWKKRRSLNKVGGSEVNWLLTQMSSTITIVEIERNNSVKIVYTERLEKDKKTTEWSNVLITDNKFLNIAYTLCKHKF